MRTRGALLTIGSAAVLVLIGCQQPAQDQSVVPPVDEPIATRPDVPSLGSPAGAIEEQALGGELRNVDLDARTFVVLAGGMEQVFTFSDATAVSGAPGTQGLAAREGARVNLRYRDENGTRRAVSITLLD